MLPASQRHSPAPFRPSDTRLFDCIHTPSPLRTLFKKASTGVPTSHGGGDRGASIPSNHNQGHPSRCAPVDENAVSLAEEINKATYLWEEKFEGRCLQY